jgi:Glu-tRNA(Gln) amidotransferase subunit E-like FAD-binding protein
MVEECRKKVGKRPWEVFEEIHKKYKYNQNQVDLLIRAEKVQKFYEYTQKLQLNGPLAYRLLIEIPRRKRREGIRFSEETIDKLGRTLSQKLITPEQIDSLAEIFTEEPNVTIEEAVKKLCIAEISNSELDKLVLEQLEAYETSKLSSDEAYRKYAVPKIVGEVLKSVDYSVTGENVVKRIHALIGREKRNVKS